MKTAPGRSDLSLPKSRSGGIGEVNGAGGTGTVVDDIQYLFSSVPRRWGGRRSSYRASYFFGKRKRIDSHVAASRRAARR